MSDPLEAHFLEFSILLSDDGALDLVQALDNPTGFRLAGFKGYYEILLALDQAEGHDFFPPEVEHGRTIVLYFEEILPPARIVLQIEILLAVLSIEEFEIKQRRVSSSSYLTEYKKFFKPFPVGRRLLVLPAWETYSGDRLAVRIDPGLAFGTGLHASTRLCLEWLEEGLQPGQAIIDAGCGSGILCAAALLLGAGRALAFDIESQAVQSTRHNLELNGCLERVRVLKSDLSLLGAEKSDLVLANLTASILSGAAAFFQTHPRLAISGFIVEQENRVRNCFGQHQVLSRRESGGWAFLYLERAG